MAMSYKWEVKNGGLKRLGTQEYPVTQQSTSDTSVLVF